MISAHSNIHPTSKIRRPKSHVAKMAVGDQQNPHFRAFLQNVFVSGPNRFKLQISIVLIFRWRLKLLVTGIYIYTIINIYIYYIKIISCSLSCPNSQKKNTKSNKHMRSDMYKICTFWIHDGLTMRAGNFIISIFAICSFLGVHASWCTINLPTLIVSCWESAPLVVMSCPDSLPLKTSQTQGHRSPGHLWSFSHQKA